MSARTALIKRNIKLYFKDKGRFLTSLITPLILLMLYATFLSSVFEDIFRDALTSFGASVPDSLIGGCVGGAASLNHEPRSRMKVDQYGKDSQKSGVAEAIDTYKVEV